MKFGAMQFDTGNNACISLRVIAEKVRTGDMHVSVAAVQASGDLVLHVEERQQKAAKSRAKK